MGIINSSNNNKGFTGGEVSSGKVGQVLNFSNTITMPISFGTGSTSITLPKGVWLVNANVRFDSDDVTVGGFLKACLSTTANSLPNSHSIQIDKGNAESDCASPVMPYYLSATEDATIYMNIAREYSTYPTTVSVEFLAVRIA